MTAPAPTLPVPVLDHPHWRVNMRPLPYEPERIPSLGAGFELIQSTKLSLRGWDYPHLSHKPHQRATGNRWIAAWSDFMSHVEYWRFYQSGQFLYLAAVREAVEPQWRAQLRHAAESHGSYVDMNWDTVPGYFSLLNFLYTVTEIIEFAARLAQRGVYPGEIALAIELRKVSGFVLTPDLDRAWSGVRQTFEPNIGRTWNYESKDLVAASAEIGIQVSAWFFERLGWLDPSVEVLRRDQKQFLEGRL
jgi:hypothetical protein